MTRLWTVKELADYLVVKRATVYLRVKERSVPHLILSRGARKACIRFRPADIEAWLDRRQQKVR